MADGPAHASWHPALMPDSHSSPPPVATTPSDPTQLPQELHDSPAPESEPRDNVDTEDRESTDAAAPKEQEEDIADAWLMEDGAESHEHAVETEEASHEPAVDPEDHEEVAQAEKIVETTGSNTAPTTSQHASSMSFARTVSHEVPFNDDDEGEWTLSRSDTDPFKAMPLSDRTNSFPVVPLMAASPETSDDAPLPSNQALDVLEETERDFDIDEHQYQSGGVQGIEADPLPGREHPSRSKHGASQSIGGEIQGLESQAFEERFDEGMPLISSPGDEPRNSKGISTDPFADDDAADGDFFTQIQASDNKADSPENERRPLERKSTMQVIGAMDSEPPTRQNTLEATLEEKDDTQTDANQTERDAFGIPVVSDPKPEPTQDGKPATEDLSAKWQEAFADSDDDGDFLLEDPAEDSKDADPTAFLGSDDEGLLDDSEDMVPAPQSAPTGIQPGNVNPYFPHSAAPQQQTSSYMPSSALPAHTPQLGLMNTTPYGQPAAQAQRPDLPQTQSFADKSKGGYASPYDLPTDLVNNKVKPRKRASMQQLPRENVPSHQAPPRSTSMYMQGSPPASGSRPNSSHGAQGPQVTQKASTTSLRNSESFFEDLPMTSKPRPSSRQSNRVPSPNHYAPPGQPHGPSPLNNAPASQMSPPGSAPPPMNRQPSATGNLVAPERASPYAAVPSHGHPVPPPSANASRYSPAPAQQSHAGAPPPAAASRYSPAPASTRQSSSFTPSTPAAAPQPALPHLPRTSSPLAHFEINSDKTHHGPHAEFERRTSSSYETRASRISSLPPTREVEEEEDVVPGSRSLSATHAQPPPVSNAETRYSSVPPPRTARRASPPPAGIAGQASLSPPKRSGPNYMPQPAPASQPGFVPPPRAQTQSPGATRGNPHLMRPADSTQRPSSSYAPNAPAMSKPALSAYPSYTRQRGLSLTANAVPPTDGREHDPLERWKGVPIMTWGVGGVMVTSFPKSIPRYAMNQTTPTILRTAGEVTVKNIRDIDPLQERLAKFPGPLKGKSKKKETVTWLSTGIETLEKELPDVSFHSQLSLEAKRAIERLLLWKLLRVFIEFDGALEGTPAVDKAVRDILSPGTITPTSDNDALFPREPGMDPMPTPVTSMQADGADTATVEQIRSDLLKGNRETAVWSAVDKRLWGHAMLISHTVSPELYQQVAQEFVRKEVNYPGHANESMAALYKVLSGNFEDCVDELVPVHARAGLQLVSKESSSGPSADAIDGLDKWRETLTLVLSNRSTDDARGLKALGKLLAEYGRAEAAHICFLFSRASSVFGGMDDPNVDFVLLGSDHRQQSDQFAKETEALQLSEVYEYGLSLSGVPALAGGSPHLAAYKLQHAITLGEYGYRDKALQYCDAIATAITSQTRRSPYYNPALEATLFDFMARLKQAPKEDSASWMSKPSMNKVSDSMWNRFNKFVAGDENDKANGGAGEAENGPFARIATTPTMSRSPSTSNFETYGGGSPGYAPNAPGLAASGAPSKYAPGAAQPAVMANPYNPSSQYAPAPMAPVAHAPNDYTSNPYEPAYPGAGPTTVQNGGYAPTGMAPPASSYQPVDSGSSNSLAIPAKKAAVSSYQSYGLQDSPSIQPHLGGSDLGSAPSSFGYQPTPFPYEPHHSTSQNGDAEGNDMAAEGGSGGYEAPSFQPYGYEPPSYEPDAGPSVEDGDDAPKPKKKSFMDDDDDYVPAPRSNDKSKSAKDRENEEMFRKAAEEDAKRAGAQQAGKKGWGLSGWFGGKKADAGNIGEQSPNKPVRAKLGESSSFVYDPDLKRWINKKPGAENVEAKTATPPPPRAGPRSVSGTPPPPSGTPPPPSFLSGSAPPMGAPRSMPPHGPGLTSAVSMESLGGPPQMMRSASNTSAGGGGPPSGPPSRPTTSMSNASSIDDLLSAAAPRKPGQKKARKSGRYVDVMAN